jgi:outer membrane protein W
MPKALRSNKEDGMKLVKVLVLVAMVALIVPQIASAADAKNEIGLFVGYVSPTGEQTGTDGDISWKDKADSAMSFGVAYQYRFTDLFSLGANLMYSKLDVKETETDIAEHKIGDITFMPLLFDGNFHVLKNSKNVDFYLGPTVGYAFWGDFKDVDGDTVSAKGEFVYGANFGLDVPFGDNWAFNAGVRYLLVGAEPDFPGAEKMDVNPWVATVGISYKF